jgi:hypothetical protein
MGYPFLFADRFSGAVVHLTTGGHMTTALLHLLHFLTDRLFKLRRKMTKCPRQRTGAGISVVTV